MSSREAALVRESEKRFLLAGAASKRSLLVRGAKRFMSARFFLICGLVAVTALAEAQQFGRMSSMKENKIGLVVHGGAGTIERGKMTPEREHEYRAGLENALRAGWDFLQHGGSGLEATEAGARTLGDNALLNAGAGAGVSFAWTHEIESAPKHG